MRKELAMSRKYANPEMRTFGWPRSGLRAFIFVPLSVLMVLAVDRDAIALTAVAWGFAGFTDTDPRSENGTGGTGNYSIGRVEAYVAPGPANVQPKPPASTTFAYADQAGIGFTGFHAEQEARGTTSIADARIRVDQPPDESLYFPWRIELFAQVKREKGSPFGEAIAPAHDPVFLDPLRVAANPLFEETVTLGSGSSVFEEDRHDEAFITLNRVSSLLTSPIFSIEIFGLGSGLVDAVVAFNPDPSLSFSTTASALEALLEDPTFGLGTLTGSISDLSFSYTWDLSRFAVTSHDTIGGGGVSFASSAPEPSSMALLILGIVGLMGCGRRSRKQG
jgi:PEP-CTERM motif-containing protein